MFHCCPAIFVLYSLSHHLQLRANLTMEKVYLALETVGLTAEKTKLENDCREGASELKMMDVRILHTNSHTTAETVLNS